MPTPCFRCNICGLTSALEETAARCESRHRVVDITAMEIVSVNYYREDAPDFYLNNRYGESVPHTITVRFSNEHNDIAKYQIVRRGMQGI